MAKQVSLREAAEILKEQGIEIRWDDNLSIEDYFSYYDYIYAPKFANNEALGVQLTSFFFEDMKKIIGVARDLIV